MSSDLVKRAQDAEKRLAELTEAFAKLQNGLGAEVKKLRTENAALKKQQASSSSSSSSSPSTSTAVVPVGGGGVAVREPYNVPADAGLSDRVPLSELFAKEQGWIGKTVAVAGWIRTCRGGGGGKFNFIHVFDGTTPQMLQVLVTDETPGFKDATQVSSSVFVHGEIVASQGRGQAIELKATAISVLGPCDPESFPLAGKGLTLEYLRGQAHLRVRTRVLGAAMRVRNAIAFATHTFYQRGGFQYVHTPLISCSDCEGGGEMFRVTTLIDEEDHVTKKKKDGTVDSTQDFFHRPAYLTVSGQLNVETYCMGLSKVYTFGPTFRAENSHTSRHLAEFWMIEPEVAFADQDENIKLATDFLKHVINSVMQTCNADLEVLEKFETKRAVELAQQKKQREAQEKKKHAALVKQLLAEGKPVPKKKKNKNKERAWKKDAGPLRKRLKAVADADFANITYTEAVELLKEHVEKKKVVFDEDVNWGDDLGSEHERYLCEHHFKRPTIVRDYPAGIKAFYMRANDEDDGKTVRAMDMLVPGIGELMGGSQREERLDLLLKKMKTLGLNEDDYWWYLDQRRFGSVPHSGFGVGFERLVQYITGLDNIRDVIPFPRTPGNANF